MKKAYGLLFLISLSILGYSQMAKKTGTSKWASVCKSDWGFFGHRRINRMATFTLPKKMFGFYKKHIEYITDHAVDPDKRRYATKHEAVRHYIDLDHWGTLPFDNVPRKWTDALARYSDVYIVNSKKDTILLLGFPEIEEREDHPLFAIAKDSIKSVKNPQQFIREKDYIAFFKENIQTQYYEEEWLVNCDSLQRLFSNTGYTFDCHSAFSIDHFSGQGIVPYHLLATYFKLRKAFEEKRTDRILQISADFGHYIGDAHVPLHTTTNYNGQLTDQIGIHGFWESRIPELFADKEYDFFVGRAKYIENPRDYFWDIVLKSHSYVDSVLLIEKELKSELPLDQQFCFDNRNDVMVRTQCESFARAYSNRMEGMVETRMRDAIYAIGCAWFSAWVDAGQPDINELDLFKITEEQRKKQEEEEAMYREGESKGRVHGQ